MKLSELADRMPLLLDLRPDFTPEKWESILLKSAVHIAQQGKFFEETFDVDLQACIPDYELDACDNRITEIRSLCWFDGCDTKCCTDKQGQDKFKIVANAWCAIPGCDGGRFRFVPPGRIEVGPVSGLSGRLHITALVAPKYDACSVDDKFFHEYSNLLFEQAAYEALTMPGEGYNGDEAVRRQRAAITEMGRLAIIARMGYHATAMETKPNRRMV